MTAVNTELAQQEFLPVHFDILIDRFNAMYKLPKYTRLDNAYTVVTRLENFRSMLKEEVKELDEIIEKVAAGKYSKFDEFRTELADFLGDVQVYCASEADRFGIRNSAVLEIIMQSNFSKLGADGMPIYDERGKVMKGPDYWKPEPTIYAYLTR